jgi:hypothetical protein
MGQILDTAEIVPDGLIVDVERTLWQKLSKLTQDLVQCLQRMLHIQGLHFEFSGHTWSDERLHIWYIRLRQCDSEIRLIA